MEYYKKVYIKSEDDLPKEEGEYMCHLKTRCIVVKPFSNTGGVFSPSWWISRVDWYLQPISLPEITGLSKDEIWSMAYDIYNKASYHDEKIEAFCEGAEYAKRKMKGGTK